MDTTDDEVEPEFVAYTPGRSKQTDVLLRIVHNKRTYVSQASIVYESEGPRFLMELEYQVAGAWVRIKRDIARIEQQNKLTNPFAWSPGPAR